MIVETKDDQEVYDGHVLPATESDITETRDWIFDWHEEYIHPNRNILSLKVHGDPNVQALMSYVVDEGFILMELLESAPSNHSQQSALKVTPTLLAAASVISFDYGFDGYTAIHIKYHPSVISQYQQYGAEIIRPDRMALSTIASTRLIQLYFTKGER
ncbi:hypothetical protein EPH95_03975 [Salicibibacter halophilus]|uniref:GNAT family N-acetyltransferase n=1 Tax=Salicibibacter halophilus TaxID=2502791 RepID=A0A514LGP1_9BACI|nr:hypothetical protein [Salicibibacter halophilus]QDI90441.1 hypothetical protein EPH95_03975 [Salicibibacter halophilus]